MSAKRKNSFEKTNILRLLSAFLLAPGLIPPGSAASPHCALADATSRPAAVTPQVPSPPPVVRDVQIRRIFAMVNENRRKIGVAELTWNDCLARAAERHAVDMACRHYFAHRSPEGRRCDYRADREGYRWTRIGENIAKGQINALEAIEDWMHSPPHRKGLLNPQYRDTGIAYRRDSSGTLVWVQLFGQPRTSGKDGDQNKGFSRG